MFQQLCTSPTGPIYAQTSKNSEGDQETTMMLKSFFWRYSHFPTLLKLGLFTAARLPKSWILGFLEPSLKCFYLQDHHYHPTIINKAVVFELEILFHPNLGLHTPNVIFKHCGFPCFYIPLFYFGSIPSNVDY